MWNVVLFASYSCRLAFSFICMIQIHGESTPQESGRQPTIFFFAFYVGGNVPYAERSAKNSLFC